MKTLIAQSILLSAAVLATAAGAGAAPVQVGLAQPPASSSAAPVRINGLTMPRYTINEFNMMPENITVSFTNESATPATDVVFGLVDSQHRTIHQYDARGTFAQGAVIVKPLPYDRIQDHQLGAEVEAVTFADGSVWTKDAPNGTESRRQAAF